MKPAQQTSKEATRAYMQGRQAAKTPPPDRDEIRRQLGWPMQTKRDCAR